jgi:hypothetical protein
MSDRIRDVCNERAPFRVNLAALEAKPPVDTMRTVAEGAVGDPDRTNTHLDAELLSPFGGIVGRAAYGVGPVRVAMRVSPRPVLPGYRKLGLDPLIVRFEVPIRDWPVGANAVSGLRLEVGRVEAGSVASVVNHRTADPATRIVLAEHDRVLATNEALLGPVDVCRAGLIAYPILVGIPERPRIEDDYPPARAGEALRQNASASTAADDDQIDRVTVAVAPHRRPVRNPPLMDIEKEARVVVLGAYSTFEEPLEVRQPVRGGVVFRSGRLRDTGRSSGALPELPLGLGCRAVRLGGASRFRVEHGVHIRRRLTLPGLLLPYSQPHEAAWVGRPAVADLVPRPGMRVECLENRTHHYGPCPSRRGLVPSPSRELALRERLADTLANLRRGCSKGGTAPGFGLIVQTSSNQPPSIAVVGHIGILIAVKTSLVRVRQLIVDEVDNRYARFPVLSRHRVAEGGERRGFRLGKEPDGRRVVHAV